MGGRASRFINIVANRRGGKRGFDCNIREPEAADQEGNLIIDTRVRRADWTGDLEGGAALWEG